MPAINAIGAAGYMTGVNTAYRQIANTRQQARQAQLTADYAANVSAARSAAANPSQPELPVQPVPPARAVTPDTSVRMPVSAQEPRLPSVDDLNNAQENAVRMRIQYPDAVTQPTGPQEAQQAQGQSRSGVNTYLTNVAGIS